MSPSEIHLWLQSLELTAGQISSYYGLLSPDERARAARFHFDRHRNHYIVARGRLREILSNYIDAAPEQIVFNYGDKGKPGLADDSTGLKFNLSHSGEVAAYAFTGGREIGVDVEEIRPQVAREQIAERFFSPNEVRSIRVLPEDRQARRFFECWTRKEAYIKALGEGLSIPLNSFDVSGEQMAGWTIRSFDFSPKYAGAVAAEGELDYAIILR